MVGNIDSWKAPESGEPYTARARVEDGAVDPSTSTVTGDRSGGLFVEDGGEVGKDDFLLLLVTQLRMQDPLDPMDNTQFLNQVAQFRSLESSNNMQKALEGLKESYRETADAQQYGAQSMTNASSVSLIGREVRLRQTMVSWHGPSLGPSPIRVHLGNASQAEVRLLDREGEVVRTMVAEGKDRENSVTLQWDGTTDTGEVAQPGEYAIHIAGQEENPALYAFVEDVVQGVRFASDGALLKVAGREIGIGNVLDVSVGEQARGFGGISPSSAIELLGTRVRARRDEIRFGGRAGEQAVFDVNLGNLSDATVRIRDRFGNDVRVLHARAEDGGRVVWDGRAMNGVDVAQPGIYSVHIDEAENNPDVYAYEEGVVDGVSSMHGGTALRINGKTVTLSEIIDIASAADTTDKEIV